jgi:DNA-binding IclR family transcriptional regulator
VFVRDTPGSRSLERGLTILRAFRLGNGVLSNADLAQRTRLPRPTVSRLCRSLVDGGFLTYDLGSRAYRLGPIVLSLSLAYRGEARLLEIARPLMEALARREELNVGLAVADQAEMVYLESLRWSRSGLSRKITAGSRVPIAPTSLGRAYLAGLTSTERRRVLDRLRQNHGRGWVAIQREVLDAVYEVTHQGWTRASWQAGYVSIAAPLVAPDGMVVALNVSFPSPEGTPAALLHRNAAQLLALAREITVAWRSGFTRT